MRRLKTAIPLLVLLAAAASGGLAAEFDIDSQRIVLRRLQFCLDCGAALLVTRTHPGVLVRCPDCGREQPRLADPILLTQVYQLCRLCESPLDPGGSGPGEAVECPNCHTRQILSPDAFPSGPAFQGKGYAAGFPPGSGKKKLLFSLEKPAAPISPIPLADETPAAVPDDALRALDIPRPPAGQPARAESIPPPAAKAVEVPAVTVDLFAANARQPKTAGLEAVAIPSPDGVAARVDGTPIYHSEVNRILEPALRRLRERAGAEDAKAAEAELRREIVERLIARELAIREAAALGHIPDPGAVRLREAELARRFPAGSGVDCRREAARDVVMADMRRRFADRPGAATPQAVRERYQANLKRLRRPRLIALDQLAVFEERAGRADRRNFRLIAGEIAQALERGAAFTELKAAHGEFPDAVPGEEPPLLPESAYASQILASAGDLRRGAVFGPLFLEGMALFGKVVDERPAGPAPFAEVEREIRLRLEAEAAEKAMDAWLGRLRQKARIEFY
ncbi:MAG: SurA N-terminal domain-containing protein [Planctomycetota bacterium]|nr:SurA N-terminal domain-containing protein [Planctomycetota bacterium]